MLGVQCQDSLWMLDRPPNNYVTTIWSRYRAADQNQFLRLAHLHHLKILHCHTPVAQVTGHPHVFPNASRRRAVAYGANAPMGLRSVRCALSGEVMLLHHTLKSLAF